MNEQFNTIINNTEQQSARLEETTKQDRPKDYSVVFFVFSRKVFTKPYNNLDTSSIWDWKSSTTATSRRFWSLIKSNKTRNSNTSAFAKRSASLKPHWDHIAKPNAIRLVTANEAKIVSCFKTECSTGARALRILVVKAWAFCHTKISVTSFIIIGEENKK